MKILNLYAENFKKLRVVEIVPPGDKNTVVITGKNGQGKTSTLDAIWAGLVGKRAMPDKPVRKGANKATIQIGLGEDRVELVVTRHIQPDGSQSLSIEKGRGNRITRPQELLDEMLGALTFDPLAFVTMKPREQVEMLRQIVKLKIDVDELAQQNAADYEERKIVNRDVERLRGQISGLVVQSDVPKEKIDEQAIVDELAGASRFNDEINQTRLVRDAHNLAIDRMQKVLDACEEDITKHEKQIRHIREQKAVAQKKCLELERKKADWPLLPEPANASEIAGRLQAAQLVNKAIAMRDQHDRIEKELNEAERKSQALTRAMEDRNEIKAQAVAKAPMPIAGLSFDDESVLFEGVPIAQMGEAMQITLGTKIAMAANPKLRVLRITNGEALDDESLALIAGMAAENNYQLWISKVDSSGKVGIVIEDGMVKANND